MKNINWREHRTVLFTDGREETTRDHVTGVRMSHREWVALKKLAHARNMSQSDFMREAFRAHVKRLKGQP